MWWEILYHVKLALARGQLWSNHLHAASVPADRLRTLSQLWISPPRAGSSRLTRHFEERVDVLLPLGKGEYNSRLSFQVRASTNICRKAPAPHYRCSSPSPQLSYLCRALKRRGGGVVLSPNRLSTPPGTETLNFPFVGRANVQGLAGTEDISFELSHSPGLQQGLDEEVKHGVMLAFILAFLPLSVVKERPISWAPETGWGRKCCEKKKIMSTKLHLIYGD